MRHFVVSGMLCLSVLPAKAIETNASAPQVMQSASAATDPTPNATMDSVGPAGSDLDASAILAPDGVAAEENATAKLIVYRPITEVCEAVTQSAKSYNLPVGFFIRLLHQESGFRPDVVSHAGAQGVAQFMPEVAASMGLENPFDPLEAIPASARLLRDLFQKFGNLGLAAAAYNAGPRRVQTWLKTKKAALPKETQGYVRIITGKPIENWKAVSKTVADSRPLSLAPCKPPEGEVVQVAEQEPQKRVRAKLQLAATKASNVLKNLAGMKTHMASKPQPAAIVALKRGVATQLAKAVRSTQAEPLDLAAKRGKPKVVKLAMGGR